MQSVQADSYSDAMKVFRNAGESGAYFESAHGYALFPTIGKGGIGVGGAHGKGKVYRGGAPIGNTTIFIILYQSVLQDK